jgi:hypothetical protein
MGSSTSGPVRLSFNPQLRAEFWGATVASDEGLLLPPEERFGLNTLIEKTRSGRGFPASTASASRKGLGSQRVAASWRLRSTRRPFPLFGELAPPRG